MKVNTDFEKWNDRQKYNHVYNAGGYVSSKGYGIDKELNHYIDNKDILLKVSISYARKRNIEKHIESLEEKILQLKEELKK